MNESPRAPHRLLLTVIAALLTLTALVGPASADTGSVYDLKIR